MAEKLDEKELVTFRELLMSNTIQVDAVTQLLMEKRVFTEDEFYTKLQEVGDVYREKLRKGPTP